MKVIFKALEKGRNEHFTLVMKEDGSIDFHKTIEGKIKSYIPLFTGTLDYRHVIENLLSAFMKSLIPIDPKDSIYQQYIILIPKSGEKLKEFYEKYYTSGEKMIIPNDNKAEIISKSMADYFLIDFLPEITKYSFGFAFVIDPEADELNYLINMNNEFFMVGLKERDFDEIIKKYLRLKRTDGGSLGVC